MSPRVTGPGNVDDMKIGSRFLGPTNVFGRGIIHGTCTQKTLLSVCEALLPYCKYLQNCITKETTCKEATCKEATFKEATLEVDNF